MEHLHRKRGSIKSKLTFFSKFLKSLTDKLEQNLSINETEVIQIEERQNHALNFVSEFDEIQNEIEIMTSDADIENEVKERETFYGSYYDQIAIAKKLIKKYKVKDDESSNSSEYNSVKNAKTYQGLGVELKPVEIPKFDGSYHNWLEFADLFESLINKNENLDNIRRFHYLRSSLEGGAAQVIKSLEFTASNYEAAWKLIRERYDNKNLLISNHVNALFNTEIVVKESAEKLRSLLDVFLKHLYALKQLGLPTENWDILLIHMLTTKLDTSTLRAWENTKKNNELPTIEQFKAFIKARADLLETLEFKQTEKRHQINTNSKSQYKGSSFTGTRGFHVEIKQRNCPICKQSHLIYQCEAFKRLTPKERFEKSRELNICTNCLKKGHFYKQCHQGTCKKCNAKHHSLFHREFANKESQQSKNVTHEVTNHSETSSSSSAQAKLESKNVDNFTLINFSQVNQVMLSTVLIDILDRNNTVHTARALLDCGSQSSFITNNLCKKLSIEKIKTNLSVNGINNTSSFIKHKCIVNIQSKVHNFQTRLNCFVVPEITGNTPGVNIEIRELKIPEHLKLADTTFHKAQKVDMLIGNDLFWDILIKGKFSLGKNKPFMQNTLFGWIIAGPYSLQSMQINNIQCNLLRNIDIQNQLTKFWELEEISEPQRNLSKEEIACEEHFQKTTQRDTEGRFIVSLPFVESINNLGDSFHQAKNRFLNLEYKLERNKQLKILYDKFIEEYLNLGHMKRLSKTDDFDRELSKGIHYFMPHHGVLKENSITTKLRVVFDCSATTTTGISLNSIQMAGPTLQSDLFSILLRFRIHSYVISADVEKMYRQVLVQPKDRKLQCILWRFSPNDPLEIYELQTATYGMKCSSYLAIKCLFTLGQEYEVKDKKIANIIQKDFYVDDLLTGFESEDEARKACVIITQILKTGGFPLRKFYSNSNRILDTIDNSTDFASILEFSEKENAKTLGLAWSPKQDILIYNISSSSLSEKITKRHILSDISQVFDPLGLLSPCIITAKIILQKLWLERLAWDEQLPINLQKTYKRIRSQLEILNNIKIPRHVRCQNTVFIELHGFCDASETAYGACIYLKSIDINGVSFINSLCAKSKVAPLKPVTLPRLELCGALILSRLLNKVLISLNINFNNIFLWSDSSVVLSWIKTSANTLKTFVSNRIAEIQETTLLAQWRHVSSKDNPADAASRGIEAQKIIDYDLWWHGPSWLKDRQEIWPNSQITITSNTNEHKKEIIQVHISSVQSYFSKIFIRFSSLIRLKRSIAYVIRFIKMCKTNTTVNSALSAQEIDNAFSHIIRLSQAEMFAKEIKLLTLNKEIDKSSKIHKLNPFLDENGILRVGGRLQNSEFLYDKKHPMIMSSDHHVTKLIFEYYHKKLMHAGPQLLWASVREFCWPLSGRNLARKTVHKCVKCFRQKPKTIHPVMGNLPAQRLTPGHPFNYTGVDYAGPYLIRDRKGRGCKLTKCYICLFICLNVKAIHIELVTELSKDSFLLAFKRFMGRRGKPKHIFSDNGTNFVAASSDIKAFQSFINKNASKISDSLSNDNIAWTFSPPYSPHFGGLWEAGVKTMKHHLRRVLGHAHLTYEEFYSVLVQVEAIINSRPLYPVSSDPNDFLPLTPAHFLIGKTLVSTPEAEFIQTPMHRLTRYQLVQQMTQHLWARWSKEYISELQTRYKWSSSNGEIMKNTMVLIKEDNLPPLKWKLGRVIEAIRGKDGHARVFKIRTSNGLITRSFAKVCPLPVQD